MTDKKETAVATVDEKKTIGFTQKGIIKFNNITELGKFAESYAKCGAAMECYRNNPANVIVAVMYGGELGMEAITSLNSIYIVNNRPALFAEAICGLVKSNPVCGYVRDEYIGAEGGDDFGVLIRSKRKGKDEQEYISQFTVLDAKKAGLWGSKKVWKEYPKRMLKARALAFNLRDNFPDVLKGIKSYEEASDINPEEEERKTLKQIMDETLDELEDQKIDPEITAQNEAEKKERIEGMDEEREAFIDSNQTEIPLGE